MPFFCMGGDGKGAIEGGQLNWCPVSVGAFCLPSWMMCLVQGRLAEPWPKVIRLGVVAKGGVKGQRPETKQARRHESTQRAVKIQRHVTKRHKGFKRAWGVNGHKEQCGFGQQASHPKEAGCGGGVKWDRRAEKERGRGHR